MIDLNRLGPEAQRQIIQKASVQHQPKYGNQKETRIIDGKTVTFDSKREAARWDELVLLSRAGKIKNLRRQPRFVLIPAQRIDGKLVEQPCVYVADFAYTMDGAEIVEDVKGVRTKEYIIKRKLMLWRHGIVIQEVG